jgi:hypothetical protein
VLAQYVHLNEINNIDAILANKLKGKFREQRKKIGKKNLAVRKYKKQKHV